MTKLAKAIFGVPVGEVYPRQIPAGEECPENLEGYAAEIGALAPPEQGADAPPPEDGKGIADGKKAPGAVKGEAKASE